MVLPLLGVWMSAWVVCAHVCVGVLSRTSTRGSQRLKPPCLCLPLSHSLFICLFVHSFIYSKTKSPTEIWVLAILVRQFAQQTQWYTCLSPVQPPVSGTKRGIITPGYLFVCFVYMVLGMNSDPDPWTTNTTQWLVSRAQGLSLEWT